MWNQFNSVLSLSGHVLVANCEKGLKLIILNQWSMKHFISIEGTHKIIILSCSKVFATKNLSFVRIPCQR
jgi:hypothetical protein